jgi:hypothetical protein
MKICQACNVEKSLDEFHNRSKAKDGKQTRCKECNKLQRKAYYKTAHGRAKNLASAKGLRINQKQKLHAYLLEHPCIDCGETDPIVLQFDHLSPENKSHNIAHMVKGGYSWPKMLDEIAKCVVRCANCHTRRTAIQFGWFKALQNNMGV